MSEIIEAVTPAQIEQVRSLFREYQAELPQEYCFPWFETEITGLPGDYRSPRGTLLLISVAGQPVGCGALRPFPLPDICEMKRLYVRPSFRGGKLGKAMAERLVTEARRLGYLYVRLDTHPPTMRAALKMYQLMGFREVSPGPEERVPGLLYMQLAL